MKPVFWKLSMGKDDFKNVLDVLEWIRQGLVLVHKDTGKDQGRKFVEEAEPGEYFYLCNANNDHKKQKQGVLLVGQFTTPANLFSDRGDGWADRQFRWIRTSMSTKRYKGERKGWAPNNNDTFFKVPEEELGMFESAILIPYFDLKLADFRIDV